MDNRDEVFIERLTEDMVDTARSMCDENVGENMYSRAQLAEAMCGDKSFFYMLYDKARTPIGYTYFLLISKEEFLSFSKVTAEAFDALGLGDDVVIGNMQSLSVDKKYRGKHYATLLFDFMLQYLDKKTNADIATGVLWRMGKEIPMKKVFEQFSFSHLTDTELVWYEREDMYCPYCKGRCVCGASVYYKKLGVEQ